MLLNKQTYFITPNNSSIKYNVLLIFSFFKIEIIKKKRTVLNEKKIKSELSLSIYENLVK